jgi:hypothetical protein
MLSPLTSVHFSTPLSTRGTGTWNHHASVVPAILLQVANGVTMMILRNTDWKTAVDERAYARKAYFLPKSTPYGLEALGERAHINACASARENVPNGMHRQSCGINSALSM